MHPAARTPLLAALALGLSLVRPALAAWPDQPNVNLPVCTAANNQYSPTIVSDGTGGAIVTWYDYRSRTGSDIYAQHVLASGAVDPAWPADGRALCTAANSQQYPTIITDGAGGAIVTWYDYRSGATYDIYAQNVNADGSLGGNGPTPVMASLVSADAFPDHVSLQWFAQELSSAVIFRATREGDWTEIARAAPDGTGMISYVDYAVTPGGRYGYRLANAATSDGAYYGETWVDVPLASEFALKGLRPNPTTHGFMIGFSLAESAPARLEVLDVGGRSVFAREVGTLGPGSHLIDLAERRIVPPGIYLVRLVQGVRALTARGVVIR